VRFDVSRFDRDDESRAAFKQKAARSFFPGLERSDGADFVDRSGPPAACETLRALTADRRSCPFGNSFATDLT
jgi:hypothetical protein